MLRAGSGPPLLLLHGLGASARFWSPIVHRLAEGFEVCAPDLPGFGSAPSLDVPPTVDALTDAVVDLLDQLGWDRPHIAGNSLGGLIALRLAQRGRAASVCAISPAGAAGPLGERWARLALTTLWATGRLLRPVLDRLAASPTGRRALMSLVFAHPERMDAEEAAALARDFISAPGTRPTLRANRLSGVAGQLTGIDCPVVIAWGTEDRLLWRRAAPRFLDAIPHARLVRLEGLGHGAVHDDPELVAELIRRSARS